MIKSFFGFLNRSQASGDAVAPKAGDIFSFRTRPYSEFAPSPTGRYAALKILGADDKYIALAVLDGIWTILPSLEQASRSAILHEHRFFYKGRKCVFGIRREQWEPGNFEDLSWIGCSKLSQEDRAHAEDILGMAVGTIHISPYSINNAAEGEWRWANDHQTFLIEAKQSEDKAAAARAAKEDRYRNRLMQLSWDQLLSETPFAGWSLPPEDFTIAARKTIHNACGRLKDLGPKLRKTEVRAILKQVVEWFNDADKRGEG